MILGQGHSLRSGLFGGIIGSCRVHLLHTQRCSARSGNFAVFLHRADNRRSTPYNHGEISRALKTIKHSRFIKGHRNVTEQASTVPHCKSANYSYRELFEWGEQIEIPDARRSQRHSSCLYCVLCHERKERWDIGQHRAGSREGHTQGSAQLCTRLAQTHNTLNSGAHPSAS